MCIHTHVVWYVHTHTYGLLLSHGKEGNNDICSKMDGPRAYHGKWSKREKQLSCDWAYMWNLKNDTNKLIYKTEIN